MQTKTKTYILVKTALMAAVLAVLSPISIPLGPLPIPLTLGVFAVYLTAALLPTPAAVASLSAYILLGAVGLPVFSSYQGGLQVLVGPTGGYIVGYYAIVVLVSLAVWRRQKLGWHMAAGALGLVLFYALGTAWYMVVTKSTLAAALGACVLPFALPDMLKGIAALALAQVLNRRLKGAVG